MFLVLKIIVFVIVIATSWLSYWTTKKLARWFQTVRILKRMLKGKTVSEKGVVNWSSFMEWVAVVIMNLIEIALFFIVTTLIMYGIFGLYWLFQADSFREALFFIFQNDTKTYVNLSFFYMTVLFLAHAYVRVLVFIVKDLIRRRRNVDPRFFSILPFSSSKALLWYLFDVVILFLFTDLLFACMFLSIDDYLCAFYKNASLLDDVCGTTSPYVSLSNYPSYLWYALGLHFQFPGTPEVADGWLVHLVVSIHGLVNKAVEVLLIGLLANSFFDVFRSRNNPIGKGVE